METIFALIAVTFAAPLAAALSLDGALQGPEITLPPGNHSLSGFDVTSPLLVEGHSPEDTFVRCAGECDTFRVRSFLALESLTLVGCGCDALDVAGSAELKNVRLVGSFYCGGRGNLTLTNVNASDGIVDEGCR